MHTSSSFSSSNLTPFWKGDIGHPFNLRYIVLVPPPWFILSWLWCIISIPIFLHLFCMLPNTPHSVATQLTMPSHLIDSTTWFWYPFCVRKFWTIFSLLEGVRSICTHQLSWIYSPYYIVPAPYNTISLLVVVFLDISGSFGWSGVSVIDVSLGAVSAAGVSV